MKIGIDARLWNQTGVGRYIRNLVKYLQVLDENNEYVLFVRSEDKEKLKAQSSKLKKWEIVESNIYWHTVAEQVFFPRILYRENLDLMHFPYFSVPLFYKRPFIITMHDLIVRDFPTGRASMLPIPLYRAKRFAYNVVVLRALKSACRIIVPTKTVKKDLISKLKVPEDKIEVTYEGASLQSSKLKVQSSKLRIKNYFLYVGNAYPHKNLERLIDAFKKVLNSKYQVLSLKLILVGKEDYFYNRLKQKVLDMDLKDSIYFLGEVKDHELVYLYKNAKALIIPSLAEGFGLTAVEAMHFGCLVLASDIPVLREVCGDVAIYFNPYNTEDIGNKMMVITNHTTVYGEYERLKKKGIERAKQFSWQKMAKETLQVYEEAGKN